MLSIIKATSGDYLILSEIGSKSFIESHGHSASTENINQYVEAKYSPDACKAELRNPKNIYHFIFFEQQPAGYSKLLLNEGHPNIKTNDVAKLERIYLLQEFYDKKIGLELLNFNIELSRNNNQSGLWLFVWTDNFRAVNFYKRAGFKIIGSHGFMLTPNHSNPNYQMFLEY